MKTESEEELPYDVNDGRTHYDGCYMHRGHHNCAIIKIQEQRKTIGSLGREVTGLVGQIERMRDDLGLKPGEKPYKLDFDDTGKINISELDAPDVEKH